MLNTLFVVAESRDSRRSIASFTPSGIPKLMPPGNAALFPAAECRPGIHEVAENLPYEQRAPVRIAANRARQRELAFIELVADRSAHKLRHPVLIEAAHCNSRRAPAKPVTRMEKMEQVEWEDVQALLREGPRSTEGECCSQQPRLRSLVKRVRSWPFHEKTIR